MQQAVILAGGLGERLRPYTESQPKPLVSVANQPFISHVVNDLKTRGISSFVFLTGYRSDLIEEFYSEDSSVICLETPVSFTKGERLKHAQDYLNDEFLLLYSDNFIPEDLGDFSLDGYDISFVLSKKIPGNFDIQGRAEALVYSMERKNELNFVELGYTSINKCALLNSLSEGKTLEGVFFEMVAQKRAKAQSIQGPYFSISDPDRYLITSEAINGKKIILIDRDGVINKRMPKGEYVTTVDECEFLEENLSGMKELSSRGFSFIVISNQAGVARGHMTKNQLDNVNEYIFKELARIGIKCLDIFTCIHGWDEVCACRKPKPGMLFEAARKYNLYLKKIAYIGDDKRDVEAAIAADCAPIFIGDKEALGNLKTAVACAPNVSLGLEKILRVYKGVL